MSIRPRQCAQGRLAGAALRRDGRDRAATARCPIGALFAPRAACIAAHHRSPERWHGCARHRPRRRAASAACGSNGKRSAHGRHDDDRESPLRLQTGTDVVSEMSGTGPPPKRHRRHLRLAPRGYCRESIRRGSGVENGRSLRGRSLPIERRAGRVSAWTAIASQAAGGRSHVDGCDVNPMKDFCPCGG
jgi:hypothetical protein